MIAAPLVTGTFQVSFTCPEPTPAVGAAAAVKPLGAPGAPRGVATAADPGNDATDLLFQIREAAHTPRLDAGI